MTHRICTSDGGGGLPYLQSLCRTLLAPNTDPSTRLERFFAHEAAEFDLHYAFLSHIDLEDEIERFETVHGTHGVMKRGTTVPLFKTYCRKTIADPEETLAVSDSLAEGWCDDPAYVTFEFGSYLGTTVRVNGELYGTLCFASITPRDDPITDKEKFLVEMYSVWIGYMLSHWDGPPIRGSGFDSIEDRAVSSTDIDLMMDALRNHRRRSILLTLIGHGDEITLATVERRMNDEKALLELIHNDLPRLAVIGYITWDADSKTIAKGPKFAEVEPLVHLLNEYNATFPE